MPLKLIALLAPLVALAIAAPAAGQDQPFPPSPEPAFAEERQPEDIPYDWRGGAAFGITTGVGVVGVSLALISANAYDGRTDGSTSAAMAVALGITPAVGTAFSHLLTRRSPYYESPVTGMLIGGYLGAAGAYLASYLYREADDPVADGEYDGGYFDEEAQDRRRIGSIALEFLVPVLSPAFGVLFGYLAGRELKDRSTSFALQPPTPAIFTTYDQRGQPHQLAGVSLVRMTF